MRSAPWILALTLASAAPAFAGSELDLPSICTDRPTKSTGPCTVDAGHWQVETDLADQTVQTSNGVRTRSLVLASPTLKYGLTPSLDLEVSASPYLSSATHSPSGDSTLSGLGDTSLRLKSVLLDGPTAISISPFIKLPTARRGLGNGKVEGGVIAPVQFTLSGGMQLLFDPEIDVLENDQGDGRHLNATGLVSLTKGLTADTNVSVELWGSENHDPAGIVRQASADLGLAWIPQWNSNLQWDAGVNLGLNKATPRNQVYLGLSRRF